MDLTKYNFPLHLREFTKFTDGPLSLLFWKLGGTISYLMDRRGKKC